MKKTKRLPGITRILATALLALLAAQTARAGILQWQDNFVGYRYGQAFREPGNPDKIAKNIYQFQHASGYAWGSNFLNIDMLRSAGSADPKAGGASGATEFYAVYRNTLSAEKITGKSMQFGGIIRDIGLTIGFDAGTKNDAFGAQVRQLFAGPTASFEVPGFLTVGLLLTKENNNNNIVGKRVYFDPTYCVAIAWGIPVLKTPFTFKGFANFIGAKGKDGFGAETAPETLIEAAIMIDPFFDKPARKGKYFVGIGYQYWNNKFGNDATHDPTGGSKAECVQFQLEFHF